MADHEASLASAGFGRSQARAATGEPSSSSSSSSFLLPLAIKTRSFIQKLHYGDVGFVLFCFSQFIFKRSFVEKDDFT